MQRHSLLVVGILVLMATAGCAAPNQQATTQTSSGVQTTSAVPTTDRSESTASITIQSEINTTLRVFLARVEPNTTIADEYESNAVVANETYSLSEGERISLGQFLEQGQEYYFELYVEGERAYETRVLTWEIRELVVQEGGEVQVIIN